MDNKKPDPSELLALIVLLLKCGCEIRLAPKDSPFGYLSAEVHVIPPPSKDPKPLMDDWNRLKEGKTISIPFTSGIDLYYHPEYLPGILKDAQMFYVRRRPPSDL